MKIRLPLSPSLLFIPALCALTLLPITATAETTVYRCGPQGRVYSQKPCADGQPLTVDDSRSDAQHRAARQSVERDQALADRLRRERREQEADWAKAPRAAAAIRSVPEQQPSASNLAAWQRDAGTKAGKRAGKKPRQKTGQPSASKG